MGIKDLWSILTPFCERKPLYELQGKTVAVDLSCWICEAQNVQDYSIQPRMYLRNLYFRTCYLLLMDVTPVFVLEGKAPTLKYQTIADRNAIQFKGAKPKTSDKIRTGKDRTRFHFVLKQCEEMLRYMGLTCVKGSGEAEAMCAYLNADGMVSGCISQDSDCFAYGAQIVYRNFSISQQGAYAASGGAVDVYDIQKAKQFLNFGRNKIIALALLCGSDYNDGVSGIGKDSALKFFHKLKDDEILNRIRLWRTDGARFEKLNKKLTDKNVCTSCGHAGRVQTHTRSGCSECEMRNGCDSTRFKEQRLDIKNELNIRSKALIDPEFPNESLIQEFLIKKDSLTELDLEWKQPQLIQFVKFMNRFLGWEEIYAFEKFLPILTRWQTLHSRTIETKGILYPNCIKKARNPKGVPSYEIIWNDRDSCFEDLIPTEQLEEFKSKDKNKNSLDSLWSTIEPKALVESAYPELVQQFLDKKNHKKKPQTKRRKATKTETILTNITEQLLNTSLIEPKPKKNKRNKTETLDNYFQPSKQTEVEFELDSNDEDDFNMSAIVDGIISRNPSVPDEVSEMGYQIVLTSSHDQSCFFQSNCVDLFETTFNHCKDFSDDDSNELELEERNEAEMNEDDTFCEVYVPLIERIRNAC